MNLKQTNSTITNSAPPEVSTCLIVTSKRDNRYSTTEHDGLCVPIVLMALDIKNNE